MAAPVWKGVEIAWGTDAGIVTDTITESQDISLDGDLKEFRDENGAVISVAAYNDFADATVEVLAKPDAEPPDRLSFVTVGGVTNYIVTKVGVKKKNDDGTRFSLSLKAWTEITPGP